MSENKSIGQVGPEAFNVSTLSNEGVVIPLTLPDGTPTDEFLQVCGADSKDFRRAAVGAARKRLEAAKAHKDNLEALSKASNDIDRELAAVLVKDWSFSKPCTLENVVAFFEDAPQIHKQVDSFAANRSHFFTKPPQG